MESDERLLAMMRALEEQLTPILERLLPEAPESAVQFNVLEDEA
jgi:hypothetical protein